MFITLEGGDGSGKTSLALLLKDELEAKGKKVLLTREPGGIDTAEKIREILMYADVEPISQVLLFAAIRGEHLTKKIIPALKEYDYVICDRFIDSSIAYQGYGMGIDISTVIEINEIVIKNNWPDLTLYLDIDPEVALARIAKDENREVNNLDKLGIEFHTKVRNGYLEAQKLYPNRINLINADQTLENICTEALKIIYDNN